MIADIAKNSTSTMKPAPLIILLLFSNDVILSGQM